MGAVPNTEAVKVAVLPTSTICEEGCDVKTGATGFVLTVRTAFELLTTIEYVPASPG